MLQEKYYPDYLNSKCIGSIEPSYISKAKEVYEYFGKDVKLIFMLRNPIKATNSMFRMRLRRVPNKYYVNLYKKYNNLDDMFNDFIENQIKIKKCKDFFYDDTINEYLKYFKKEQMKFIVMEDFFKNPNKYMKEISKFLNIKNIKLKITALIIIPSKNLKLINLIPISFNSSYFLTRLSISSLEEIPFSSIYSFEDHSPNLRSHRQNPVRLYSVRKKQYLMVFLHSPPFHNKSVVLSMY